nr:PTS glucose transporter subunit IIA [Lactobacillus helveticus]
MWIVSVLISFAVAFILTYVYGKGHLKEEVAEQDVPVNDAADYAEENQKAEKLGKEELSLKDEIIVSPVNGTPESLTKVNDQVFSAKLMGDGAAVIPSDGTIYSPVTGTVTIAYESKHAYGIKSDNGAEVLIHISLDAVKKAGYDTTVMVVITNTANYANVQRITDAGDKHGDKLIAVTAHN